MNAMNNSSLVWFFIKFSPRITASLLEIEKATAVSEVMVASSVSVAHSAPDQTSENDEGFVEPKHHFFKKKVTYEVSSKTYLYFLNIINAHWPIPSRSRKLKRLQNLPKKKLKKLHILEIQILHGIDWTPFFSETRLSNLIELVQYSVISAQHNIWHLKGFAEYMHKGYKLK